MVTCLFKTPGSSLYTWSTRAQGPDAGDVWTVLAWGGAWYCDRQRSFGMWGPTESSRKLSPGGSESESGEGVFWAEGTVCITTRVGRCGCSRVRGKFPSRDGHSLSLACARQTEGQSLSPSLGCFSPEPEGGGTRQFRPFLGVAW